MKLANTDKVKVWQSHLEAAEVFGDGVQAYCRSQGIQVSTFYSWRKKLAGETREPLKSAFLPVVVRAPRAVAAAPTAEPAQKQNHRRENLPDAKWVAEVIAHLIRGLS